VTERLASFATQVVMMSFRSVMNAASATTAIASIALTMTMTEVARTGGR